MASYLPQRTDNDIKNYWNAHLKKKLNKSVSNTELASSSSCSQANTVAKGQWERQLQTNIHLAKQSLCDALALDNNFTTSPPLQQLHQPYMTSLAPPPPGNFSTTPYPSSVENVTRLLPNWLKDSHKSSQPSSESISTFNHQFLSPSTSEGFKNYNNLDVLETTSLLHNESRPDTEAQMPSFSFLENCAFDEATAQEHEGFVNMQPLDDNDDLF
ncbi:putative transcription factor MYB-HB-like family [Helianthus annuus]|nr:putative transcription factor MYB-HB-like family [Helianthus annuus]